MQQTDNLRAKPIYYSPWKQLVMIWTQMKMLTFWEVGKDKEIRFWEDVWIKPGLKLITKLQNQSIRVNP